MLPTVSSQRHLGVWDRESDIGRAAEFIAQAIVIGLQGGEKPPTRPRLRVGLATLINHPVNLSQIQEELNPDQPFGSAIALPPDASITTDLAAPRWELIARGIKIENRKRLGRSPDATTRASAVRRSPRILIFAWRARSIKR
jgi:hypothetical protein